MSRTLDSGTSGDRADVRPRVIVIANSYPGPKKPYAAIHVQRHVQLHVASGLRVKVLAPQGSDAGIAGKLSRYARLALMTSRAALTGEFDIVHAHWPFPAGFLGLLLARLRGRPLVVTSHGAFVDNLSSKPWLVRRATLAVLRGADELIAVGSKHRQEVARLAGRPESSVHQIDMGVPVPPHPPSRSLGRQRLGLPRQGRLVIFLGNLRPEKGVDVLIRAAAELRSTPCPISLIIGGQGPESGSLRTLATRLGLADSTRFLGAVPPDDVCIWLSAADVCVVPSRREAFGLLAVESMACGTPVVAAAVGGLRQTIRPDDNGVLFQPEDHAALARQLQRVLSDEDLRSRLSEGGRRTARAFDVRRKADEVLQIYMRLAAGPTGPRRREGRSR